MDASVYQKNLFGRNMAIAMPKSENANTFPKLLMGNARVRGNRPAYREKKSWHLAHLDLGENER
jgi:hypothetical protein